MNKRATPLSWYRRAKRYVLVSGVSGLGVKICYVSMPYASLGWVLNQVWQKQQTFLLWLLSAFLWPSFSSIKWSNCIYPIGKLWRLNTTSYCAWHQENGSFPLSSLVQTSSKYCNNSEGKYHCGISEGSFREITGCARGSGCTLECVLVRRVGGGARSASGAQQDHHLVRSTVPCSPGEAGPRRVSPSPLPQAPCASSLFPYFRRTENFHCHPSLGSLWCRASRACWTAAGDVDKGKSVPRLLWFQLFPWNPSR